MASPLKIKNNFMKKYWFRRKRYGWGWFPVTWQGWIVTLGFVLCIVATSIGFGTKTHPERLVWFFVSLVIALIAFITICYKTGEPLKWQWGEKGIDDMEN